MIHSSWVCVAWVLRARSGRATFSDAIAAATAPSARQTTAVTAAVLTGGEPGRVAPIRRAPGQVVLFTVTSDKKKERSFCEPSRPRGPSFVKNEYSFSFVVG